MSSGCKIRAVGALFLTCLLEACPTRPPPGPVPVLPGPALPPIAPHTGQPYDIVTADSLLTVRVYRGGTLASAGHNHVIASHTLLGTVYVPGDLMQSSFELHLAVAELTVDERELRAQESAADFPPDVPQPAREGTRRNMLGPAVLDADDYPEVVLRAERPGLESRPGAAAGDLTAYAEVQVRDQRRRIALPLHYELAGDTLSVTGETTLRQSELGLTPFTALMGALAVQDEMRVRFRIVARATSCPAPPAAPSPGTPCAAPRR